MNAPDNPVQPAAKKMTDRVAFSQELRRLASVVQNAVKNTTADVKADANEIAKQHDEIDAQSKCMRCLVDSSRALSPEQLNGKCRECGQPYARRKHVCLRRVNGANGANGCREGDSNAGGR